jgi:hypothetical protein
VLGAGGGRIETNEKNLFGRYVPLAALTIAMAAYYAFRSYDYTLLIAALPFAALTIPAVLSFVAVILSARGPARLLVLIPVLVAVPALTFAILALNRPDAAYSFAFHECRFAGRCSPAALAQILGQRLWARAVLDETGNYLSDRWIGLIKPPNLIRDAVAVIEAQAGRQDRITVLLGETMASELALLPTGKWQRWPISFSFTDQLVPSLADRIVAAPLRLRAGEFVLVRRDEASLGAIEAGILQRIRSEATLCPLPEISPSIAAYRVAGLAGCAP